MDRRKAIKLLAGGTSVSLVSASPVIAGVMAGSSEQKNKQLAMVVDLRRCNGCKACVTACSLENGNTPDEHRTQVLQGSTKVDGKELVLNLPLLCNQCENPVCTKTCPTGATFKRKEDGIVVVDSTGCIDCNFCVYSCPYEGVRFTNSKTGTVDKCNFCIQRTSQGFLPACVETCTGGARVFGDLKDPDSEISKLLQSNEAFVLQSDKNTKPNVFYIGLSREESNTPYNLNSELTWQR
ncbi:4Fe-4S dicluster domain-containing protein [Vibrio sp. SCSIO 43137]|uniref:4Fe-4S dicluster domain-containing protein n=1 Tax=Vibrio sp. SCSIO 43137 TaxID=3021011 RepID=UPI002307D963|nr:4Fe-4S dicluster domain-containing protein [Vibrio sp. SCSIO 43137]WCE30071.1 4Fe-4S dicluster domain-containing protein [Vibrio sp. SCSIO 43137]